MSNNKQTSVDHLFDQLSSENLLGLFTHDQMKRAMEMLDKAKAMHKKEILESYRWGRYDSDKLVMSERFYREQYYEQTFGGDNGK